MSDNTMNFTVGELIIISNGLWPTDGVIGLFKVLVEFDAKEQLINWTSETDREVVNGSTGCDWESDNIHYMPWLNRNGFIEDVTYRNLHIGGGGGTELYMKKQKEA